MSTPTATLFPYPPHHRSQTTPRKAHDRRKAAFLAGWHSTLQILRDIGSTVSLDAKRPAWVDATASPGAQADQFLHAHYYHRTFDGRKADYERHYAQNHANPIKARSEAITWWHGLASAPTNEDRSEEHTSELQSLMRISYAVFCLKKKTKKKNTNRRAENNNQT